ncbi:MAG TPA: HDOD domain-containing protein [Pseudobacteroides sp.]|nr:HDOD domain-containing protein [Pseudobacteroides sp.]
MQNHPIISLIEQSDYLPKIPKSFGETLDMLLDPCEFNINDCIEKLSNVPDIESTLLRTLNINSKLNREILSLKEAVVYLGAKNTRMIAIAFITRLLLPSKSGRAKIFNNKTYWKHCIGTSIASSMIAADECLCDKEKIFTYGLIHDIGITVLDICLPDHLDKIYELQLKGLHQIAAEKIILNGLTHADIGIWICNKWGLPEEIKEIVGYHHTPFISCNFSNEVKIMYVGDFISTKYYEGVLGTKTTFIYYDKISKLLNLPKELLENIAIKLPEEVEKVSRVIKFEF